MCSDHFDHLPTPEELAESYLHAEETNPQSLYYKRTLVRPNVPILRIILFMILIVGSGAVALITMNYFVHNALISILFGMLVSMIVTVLLSKPLLIVAVHTYQALASDKVRNRCRYEPSCSVYMIQAVEKYGFWRGFRKGIKRWRSCKPPNGGIDLP